ncbi:MAG: hypothetical protein EPO26_07900 [Chloroflexota bacterium]|nr:MAG: hypothetical protein EPO26_07900 [Chloroflexota bacterium]
MADLVARAGTRPTGSDGDLVGEWLHQLDAEGADGEAVVRNLRDDARLERESDGETALDALIAAIVDETELWRSPGSGVEWLRDLSDRLAGELLCRGPDVPDDEDTDTVCRIVGIIDVRDYLVQQELRTADLENVGAQRFWADDLFGPSKLGTSELDPSKDVRGELPIAWATPLSDRVARWPVGTETSVALQVCGIDPQNAVQCVLTFRQSRVGRASVPTGLDAQTHPHFRPSNPGDPWGYTRDLTTANGDRGVREGVVRAFKAALLDRIEVV